MSDIPPEYEATRALEQSFRRAGEERAAELATSRRRTRRTRALGPVIGGGLAFVIVGGGLAIGGKSFIADDDAADPGTAQPTFFKRAPADRRLALAQARDPVEREPWGLRLYTSARGRTCVVAGRVVAGRLGRLQSGKFSEFSSAAPGICTNFAHDHLTIAMRVYGTGAGARTLLYGVTDRTVTGLAVGQAKGFRTIPIARDGTYIVVRTGAEAFRSAHLRIHGASGTTLRPLGPAAG